MNETTYSAPSIVSGMRKFLSWPRNFNTNDFAMLVSPERPEQLDYGYGLIFVSFLVGSIFVVWGSTLLILKCMGNSVGCASGKATRSVQSHNLNSQDTGSVESDLSGSDEFSENDSQRNLLSRKQNRRKIFRIRLVFLIAGVAAIAFTICAFLLAFRPVKDAVNNSDETLTTTQAIVDKLYDLTRGIKASVEVLNTTLTTESFNFTYYCPNVDPGPVLGTDLEGLGNLVEQEIDEIQEASRNVTSINNTLVRVQQVLDTARVSLSTTDDYLWVIPGILCAIGILCVLAIVGLLLAWKRRSSQRIQTVLAYAILPSLIILSIVVWVLTIGAGVGTMVTGDACIALNADNSTILRVLQENGVNETSNTYRYIDTYTNGCNGDSPTSDIDQIAFELQDKVELIWRHVTMIDSAGRDKVSRACGKDLTELIYKAETAAASLTSMQKSLQLASKELDCERIYPLYADVVYDATCTSAASGVAWGFLFLFLISVTTMVVVTLRSAWYHGIRKEKVYDEDEVADNMVLDEHEDYLNYISQYKHEWQEYNGINPSAIEGADGDGDSDPFDDTESTSESDGSSDGDREITFVGDDPHTPGTMNTDDISFPSLIVPAGDSSQQPTETDSWLNYRTAAPSAPPLLPPVMVAVPPSRSAADEDSVDTVDISLPDFVIDDMNTDGAAVEVSLGTTLRQSATAPPLVHVSESADAKAAPEPSAPSDQVVTAVAVSSMAQEASLTEKELDVEVCESSSQALPDDNLATLERVSQTPTSYTFEDPYVSGLGSARRPSAPTENEIFFPAFEDEVSPRLPQSQDVPPIPSAPSAMEDFDPLALETPQASRDDGRM